jgi:hypothetical protein
MKSHFRKISRTCAKGIVFFVSNVCNLFISRTLKERNSKKKLFHKNRSIIYISFATFTSHICYYFDLKNDKAFDFAQNAPYYKNERGKKKERKQEISITSSNALLFSYVCCSHYHAITFLM